MGRNTAGDLPAANEGQVHGRIVKSLCGVEPSEITQQGGELAGFAIMAGELKFNSKATNMNGECKDGSNKLNPVEEWFVTKVVSEWMKRRSVGFNLSVASIAPGQSMSYSYTRDDA